MNNNIVMEIDLSQAESRVIYMLTRDKKLIEEARALPWEYDMHTANAQDIFKLQDVTKNQRFLGKKTVHAAQRGMRGKTMSESMLKEGYILTPTECETFINAYFEAKRSVQDVYFFETRMTVRHQRKLVNSWGRVIEWTYDRITDDLYREAYSWPPQSEVADLLNQWGLIPTYQLIKQAKLKSKLMAQVHDSLLLATNLQEAYMLASFIKQSLERPRVYYGEELVIPITLKIGRTWEGSMEWKKFPCQEEFMEEAKKII